MKWENKVVYFGSNIDELSLQTHLNTFGASGWEPWAVLPDKDGGN
jgi:hypothetical protein